MCAKIIVCTNCAKTAANSLLLVEAEGTQYRRWRQKGLNTGMALTKGLLGVSFPPHLM